MAEAEAGDSVEPENIDKEFFRKWFASNCDPYKDEKLPDPPSELVHELSRRYIMLYEIMLGKPYEFTSAAESVNDSVLGYFRDK